MTVETTSFSSTNLASGEYDTDTDTLTIEFVDGSAYDYMNVPKSVWVSLKNAASPGAEFHRNVKNRYSYSKV